MTRERWRAVARVEKTHGRRGEVVAVAAHGLPPLLQTGHVLAVVPPSLSFFRRLEISSHVDRETGQLISFKEVNDLQGASLLVGKTLLLRLQDMPPGWELLDMDLPIGLSVIDERLGEVGHVVKVEPGANGRVWSVAGESGETLIPAVCDLVKTIDLSRNVALCSLPVGLVPGDGE